MQKKYQTSDILLPIEGVSDHISYDYIGPYFECDKILLYMGETLRDYLKNDSQPQTMPLISAINDYESYLKRITLFKDMQRKNRYPFTEFISSLIRHIFDSDDHDIDVYCKRHIASKICDDPHNSTANYEEFMGFVMEGNEISDELYYTFKRNYDKLSDEEYLFTWECIGAKQPAEDKLKEDLYKIPKLGSEIYIYPSFGVVPMNSFIHFYKKFCHIVKSPKGAPINTWIRGNFTVTDSMFLNTTNELMLNAIKPQHFENQNPFQNTSFNLIMQKRVEKTDIISHDRQMKHEPMKIYDHIGEHFKIDAAYFYVDPAYYDDFNEYAMHRFSSHGLANAFRDYLEKDMKNYNGNAIPN